jgi:hypothetical protein
MVVADFGYCSCARLQNVSRDLCCCLERKNIKEEGKKEGGKIKRKFASPP